MGRRRQKNRRAALTDPVIEAPPSDPVSEYPAASTTAVDAHSIIALYETVQPVNGEAAVVFEKGARKTMEDIACCGRLGPEVHLYAVFDGHAGANVALHLAQTLPERVLAQLRKCDLMDQSAVAEALSATFLSIDDELFSQERFSEIREEGSTAVMVLRIRQRLYFANLGDSRAVLFQGSNILHATSDHTPGIPAERERIEAAGGWVTATNGWGRPGPYRVNGMLAVARAFGDASFKRLRDTPLDNHQATPYPGPAAMVTAVPTITIVEQLDPALLALATDGLWGVIDNDLFVKMFFDSGSGSGSETSQELDNSERQIGTENRLMKRCQELVKMALLRGSSDNITLLVVELPALCG